MPNSFVPGESHPPQGVSPNTESIRTGTDGEVKTHSSDCFYTSEVQAIYVDLDHLYLDGSAWTVG